MNKNIIIIVVAALAAFMAVLLIPRLLERDVEAEPLSESSRAEAPETGSAGSQSSGPAQPRNSAPATSNRAPNPLLEAQLAEAVRQVNATTPITIDEMTTMTAARSQGIRIQYRYELSTQLNADQVRQFEQFASRQNQQTICSRTDTRELIDLGGEIEYMYYGPGNQFLFSTPIVGC